MDGGKALGLLSDLGAGLMGGLGLAPSADIGDDHAVFQPCHGSAPDIAGQGIANPFAMILSAAMMLDWLGATHGIEELASDGIRLREAVESAISDRNGVTRDLGGTASTAEAAAAIAPARETGNLPLGPVRLAWRAQQNDGCIPTLNN